MSKTNTNNTNNLPALIKICTFGMDEHSLQRLETMFAIIFKGRFVLSNSKNAMIALLDIHEKPPASKIEEFRQLHPQMPAIVLHEEEQSIESMANTVFLLKPLNREQFWQAVIDLFDQAEQLNTTEKVEKINVKTANSAATIDKRFKQQKKAPQIARLTSDKMSGELFYDPSQYLLGYLQTLLQQKHPQGCSLHLNFAADNFIILYPGIDMAISNLSDIQMKNLCLVPLGNKKNFTLSVQTSSAQDTADIDNYLNSAAQDSYKIPIDNLLWTLALRTSKGRLVKGISSSKPLTLKSWPNLSRLCVTPHAMRIAAFWAGQPLRLVDIASALDITLQDMFSFCSAAHSIGLVHKVKRKEDKLIEAQVIHKKTKKRGLFGAILRYMK